MEALSTGNQLPARWRPTIFWFFCPDWKRGVFGEHRVPLISFRSDLLQLDISKMSALSLRLAAPVDWLFSTPRWKFRGSRNEQQ